MSNKNWGLQNIPNQKGTTIIITGASSGLGKEATKVLAQKNATVIMAVRNIKKAEAVASEIKRNFPESKIEVRQLELGSLDSIKSFVKGFISDYTQLDTLINNAGVMACPFSKTEDGFEIQMGTNHLGHFALTGLLMPLLKSTKNSKIVVTSSVAHRQGNIDFNDINWENRNYKTGKAYGDSKLANLYFAYELVKRQSKDTDVPMVTIAHPGWTKTDLDRHSGLFQFLGNIIAQTVQMGTLPSLRAATDDNAKTGEYYGPSSSMELRGHPVIVQSNKLSHDAGKATKIWDMSEKLTGVRY